MCPISNTITAFYDFVADTKARSSQVNANFDNFRGNLIPIEPLTATSSNLTYNLGSSDHRWLASYLGSIDLRSSTTTAGLTIEGDTSATSGAFLFKIGGTEKFRIKSSGQNAWRRLTYTSAGVYATGTGGFLAPTDCEYVVLEGSGAGGGGGGGGVAVGGGGGGGGGAGAARRVHVYGVTPGTLYAVVVGAGGAGGGSAAAGTRGGDTTFASGTIKFGGAPGGNAGTAVAGGAGHTKWFDAACLVVPGGAGAAPGGNGSAGETSEASPAGGGGLTTGGPDSGGGGGGAGFGPGGLGGGSVGAPANGQVGGGGGGGRGTNGTGQTGGTGGDGLLYVHWYGAEYGS